MRSVLGLACVVGLFGLAGTAPAQDQEARAVVERAIQATGGAEALGRLKALTLTMKGKYYGLGAGIDYTGAWSFQLPEQAWEKIESEANGMKFTLLRVINRNQGWQKLNDMLMDLDKDQLAEARHELYVAWVGTLVPLADPAFKLAPLGESMVEGRPAVGVQVAREGQRDVNLYFDKQTGLLVKDETRVKDMQGMEVRQETYYSDFKPVQGIQYPRKIVMKRDGKDYVDGETTEIKFLEKLDDSTFAKP